MPTALTAKQELVLRPGTDIDKYKKLVLNKKSGRTDHKMVRTILLEVAEIYGVARDFGKYDKGRMIRRRLLEVVDSTTDESVAQIRQSVKQTGGKVDLGMVTEEAFGKLVSKVDDLATAMALLAKVVADKS